jgi:hypothetical protein
MGCCAKAEKLSIETIAVHLSLLSIDFGFKMKNIHKTKV